MRTLKVHFILIIILYIFTSLPAFGAKFTAESVEYDATFRLGLVNGPGTGISLGGDIYFPFQGLSLGLDLEQQVTNSELEQNINILKYGVALKQGVSEDFYMTYHLGTSSFYLAKSVNFIDSFSGEEYTIDEDTHGSGIYYAISPYFRVGEFWVSPRIVYNRLNEGGSLFEMDLNIAHSL